ncbi:MAG: DUF6778 family protein [Pseudomonadota bacterium]
MKKQLIALCALATLAGCSGQWSTNYETPMSPAVTRGWTVNDVIVQVPATLSVSDANTLAPDADIVWHGDAPGDRRAQVAAILEQGIMQGARGLSGDKPVTLVVTAQEFHAVTPAALSRAPNAVHNISYFVQAYSADGEPLTEPQLIEADLQALVGGQAITAAQSGQTQKSRITAHVSRVTAGWLGLGPDVRGSFRSIGR